MVLVSSAFSHQPKEKIHTDRAPEPIGPYSQGIHVRDYVFISGQIGIDPKTGLLAGGIEDQTHQVMKNVQAILSASGLDFKDVVNAHIYLTNLSDFPTVNGIYAEYLKDAAPSRSTIEVSALPKDAFIEIDMIAENPE
ncbi:MAG: RidA family protein [Methanospirillaceae archaeon]|nr:RidA family protein [Methanospirillaceae archaeon]